MKTGDFASPFLWSLYYNDDERQETAMSLFKKKSSAKSYDKDTQKPVIKASICNGEQVAGFKDLHTGKFEEVMLICSAADLDAFRVMYGITEEITKEY